MKPKKPITAPIGAKIIAPLTAIITPAILPAIPKEAPAMAPSTPPNTDTTVSKKPGLESVVSAISFARLIFSDSSLFIFSLRSWSFFLILW